MKKLLLFIILIIIVSLCFCLIACNKQVIDVNYKFTNAYAKIGESLIDIEIKNCILYNGTLPTKGE